MILKLINTIYSIILIGYFISFSVLWAKYIPQPEFTKTVNKNPYFFLDYTRYYVLAKITNSKDRNEIYNPNIQKKYFSAAIAPAKPYQYFSQYPPQTGLLMYPWQFIPLNYGYAIFIIFSLLTLGLGLTQAKNQLNPISNMTFISILLGIFASMPMVWSILLGQVNILLVAALSFFLIDIYNKKYILGLLSSLFLSIKPHK